MTMTSNAALEPDRKDQTSRLRKLAGLRRIVLFAGNPRAGTTLVRSLLNAHPQALVANEANLLRLIERGMGKAEIIERLIDNEAGFAARPSWTGYDYGVDFECSVANSGIAVIADKKAAWTARAASADWSLIERLWELFAPLPIQLIHCVRHPLDCIATRARHNGLSLTAAMDRYFEVEQMVADMAVRAPFAAQGQDLHRVYLERLIAEPMSECTAMLGFVGLLPTPDGYLDACAQLLAAEPRRSRGSVIWSDDVLAEVARRAGSLEHLHPYLEDLCTAGPPRLLQ